MNRKNKKSSYRSKTKKQPKRKIDKVLPNQHKEDLISIIILSDSPGYRMKSYGSCPLITVNNKYLLDLQIEAIKNTYSNYEIILCTGFDSDKIAKYISKNYSSTNIRIVENQIFSNSNSCESLRLSLNNTLNDKILVINGSLLFNKHTLKCLDNTKICTLIQKNPIENLQIGVNINYDVAQYFSFGAYKTWSEIIFLNDAPCIDQLKKFLSHPESKKKFLFEGLNDLIKNKIEIKCIENKNVIYKIDNIKTYHHIKENHEIFNI